MWGFAPTRRVPFVSAKGTKTISACARSPEPAEKQALRDASASVPNKMAQELALLKQPSPRSRFGTEAPPRPTQVIKDSPNIRRNEAHSFGVAYPLFLPSFPQL
jgi:hypothetical protein